MHVVYPLLRKADIRRQASERPLSSNASCAKRPAEDREADDNAHERMSGFEESDWLR